MGHGYYIKVLLVQIIDKLAPYELTSTKQVHNLAEKFHSTKPAFKYLAAFNLFGLISSYIYSLGLNALLRILLYQSSVGNSITAVYFFRNLTGNRTKFWLFTPK
jgi:hypothetical protein